MVQIIDMGKKHGKSAFEGFLEGAATGLSERLEENKQIRKSDALLDALPFTEEQKASIRGKNVGIDGIKLLSSIAANQAKANAPADQIEFMKQAAGYNIDPNAFGTPQDIQKGLDVFNNLKKSLGTKGAAAQFFPNMEKYFQEQTEEGGYGVPNPKFAELEGNKDEASEEAAIKAKKLEANKTDSLGMINPLMRTLFKLPENVKDDKKMKPVDSFTRGMTAGSSGKIEALTKGISTEDWKKSSELPKDAGVVDRLLYAAGNLYGDSLNYAAGGAAGGAIGASAGPLAPIAMVGGGVVGGMTLNSFVNATLDEFMKSRDINENYSFEDYLTATANVAQQTSEGAAEGILFGTLSKVIPILKASNPKMKKFFETKNLSQFKEIVGTTALQTAGSVGSKAVAKGELPSKQELVDTFVQTLGLNLGELKSPRSKAIVHKLQRTSNPEAAIKDIKSAAEKAGINLEAIKPEGAKVTPAERKASVVEEKKLYRVVEDITKKYKGKASIDLVPQPTAEQGKALEAANKEKAAKLGEAPLEKYLIEKKKTVGKAEKQTMEAAVAELKPLNESIKKVKENIETLQNQLDEGIKNKKTKAAVEKTLAQNKKQLDIESARQKDLKYAETRGRFPFSEEETRVEAKKRIKTLEESSKNPEQRSADDIMKLFDRDVKYVVEERDIVNKGRGDLEPYKDWFLKKHGAYSEEYKNTIKDVNERLKTAKGKGKKELEAFKKNLERNLAVNEAKQTIHRDKISSKKSVKEAKALVKSYLQKLKKDLPGLQEPIIKYKKYTDAVDAKATKAFDNTVKEVYSKGSETAYNEGSKKPAEELIEKLEEKGQVTKEEVEEVKAKVEENSEKINEASDAIDEEIRKGFDKNEPYEDIAKRVLERMNRVMQLKYPTKTLTTVGVALVFDAINTHRKEQGKRKIPTQAVGLMFKTLPMKLGLMPLINFIRNSFSDSGIDTKREEFQKIRNPGARERFRKELISSNYTKSQIKKIISR